MQILSAGTVIEKGTVFWTVDLSEFPSGHLLVLKSTQAKTLSFGYQTECESIYVISSQRETRLADFC